MTQNKQQNHPLSRLLNYMKPHRVRVIWAVVFSIMNKVVDLAPPALIGVAVEIVVNQEKVALGRPPENVLGIL